MLRNLFVAALWMVSLAACSRPPAPTVPLYDNLGGHQHQITTSSPDAQKYFDQGVRLSYAFNHGEAIRAFKQAIALDASCAMCYWGVAFALGPEHQRADHRGGGDRGVPGDRAGAEARRAPPPSVSVPTSTPSRSAMSPIRVRRVAPLDAAYADAMRELARRFPDDLDASTLFAQSLMDTSPWNYWNLDGTPREFTDGSARRARVGPETAARSCGRHPSVHPRRRSVAQSGPRRSVCRQARGADAGRRPYRAHARPHLPADGPLSRSVRGRIRTPPRSTSRTSPATARPTT